MLNQWKKTKVFYLFSFFASILLTIVAAQGEYRAFKLRIFHPETSKERFVTSTLDSIQYVGYHPLSMGEKIEMTKTWRCRGNTGNFKPICPLPESEEISNTESSKKGP